MKKFIYTSIQEFIENGGKLEKDREIFVSDGSRNQPKFELAGYFLRENGDHSLAYNGRMVSFPIGETAFFVKIEVTPIWK